MFRHHLSGFFFPCLVAHDFLFYFENGLIGVSLTFLLVVVIPRPDCFHLLPVNRWVCLYVCLYVGLHFVFVLSFSENLPPRCQAEGFFVDLCYPRALFWYVHLSWFFGFRLFYFYPRRVVVIRIGHYSLIWSKEELSFLSEAWHWLG